MRRAKARSGSVLVGLLFFLPLLAPRTLAAAELLASPFRGATIPAAAVAGDADATAIETNPGQLGLLDGASLALVVDHWSGDTRRVGRGTGLLVGAPVGGMAFGAGYQWMRPTFAFEPASYGKLQLGFAVRASRAAGIGISWEHLFEGDFPERNSLSLGFGARLHPRVALGISVRDLNRPWVQEPGREAVRLPLQWEGELALRPLGTDRLEAAAALRYEQGAGRAPRPRFRLSLRLARGFSLFAEVDAIRDHREEGWDGLAGIAVDFDRVGISAAGVASRRIDGEGTAGTSRAAGPGGSFVLRVFPARRPPLVEPQHIQRVVLSKLDSDRRFLQTVVRLRRLYDDPAVGAVLLEIDDLGLGLARIQELRALVEGLRRRKPVFAQVSTPSMQEYYLATACERIIMHPAGTLTLSGAAQTVTFYKGALDKLGVKVDLVRIAEYKGAMEPFILTENSPAVRDNRNALLDDQYSRMIQGIGQGRAGKGVPAEKLPALVDRAVFVAAEAQQEKLVDAVADEKETEKLVPEALGRHWSIKDDLGARDARVWRPSRVGVVLVDGAIADGGPDRGFPPLSGEVAFADGIVNAVNDMKDDGSVKAVVLRVNSPGGSVFGSDRIARAVARLRGAGKPVIVSMGDVAASGGYYIAAPASEILASPGTTTGSIGIFGYKVDLQALAGRVGVSVETYKRGAHSDFFSPFRPWTDEERNIMQQHMGQMYQLFLNTVAAGRKSRGMTVTRANELGRGRVWSGAQALDIRLVDRLGGLADAIDEAARLGHVQRGPGDLPELVVLPRPTISPLETLARLGGVQEKAELPPLLQHQARGAIRLLAPILLGNGSGIEARLPYDIGP
jgi:protease-4